MGRREMGSTPTWMDRDGEREDHRCQRLRTARSTAEELGVSERTVRRWIGDGRLDAKKSGGAFLIDMDAARRTLSQSRVGRRVEQGELYGRYIEVCERLDRALDELAKERARADRLEAVLYIPAASSDGVSS